MEESKPDNFQEYYNYIVNKTIEHLTSVVMNKADKEIDKFLMIMYGSMYLEKAYPEEYKIYKEQSK